MEKIDSKLSRNDKDREYLEYLSYYYDVIKRDYRVGLEGEQGYIDFRKWSTGDIYPTSKNIHESLKKKMHA